MEQQHPIEGLMTTAMESIKDMVDVNTIVGDAVQSPDGTVIIPISKVSFGFAAGGGEYNSCCETGGNEANEDDEEGNGGNSSKFPFAGGSGAGVSINPVAFMVVGQGQIKLLPVTINSSLEKILDMVPDLIEKANESIKKKIKVRKSIKELDEDED
ncbi:GerW family sporulation protein [Herbivorax sp. ANBcel31]|uniref:GerW family sporulation protein n=1 Tax=Herbivorax sp. ANBcel31 TaxID=3069754 RepID=UPI0027B07E62|nr:GerW family sporulation protein [Herbivorax sp. ANBcel31]MDQ2085754.1 GerW family sporulation protein [Herbivorax sp. ANBcel31]